MTAAAMLMWAEIGAKLITVLGVPVASVIKLFRDAGGTEAELMELIGRWAGLITDVQTRIAFLKSVVAALEG